MRNFFATFLDEASGHGRRLAVFAIVLVCAVLIGIVGAGFIAGGAYMWIAPRYGAAESALGIGVVLIVVAVITALASSSKPSATAQAKANAASMAEKAKDAVKSSTASTPTAVNSLLQALQDGGRDRERLALLATSEAIKSASPLQLVVTGLVAGYIGGQMLKQTLAKQTEKRPS